MESGDRGKVVAHSLKHIRVTDEVDLWLKEQAEAKKKPLQELFVKDLVTEKTVEVEAKCDQWHISQEVFDLINESFNRELTIYDGKPKDAQKLLNDLLKKLFQDRLNKSKDRWPDGKCYFREIISDTEGFCYENSPRPPYRIKPKSCWACLIRKKKLRLESRVHTANGVQAYKSVESECQYHRLPNWCGKSGGTCSGTECIYHPRHEDRDQGSPRTW